MKSISVIICLTLLTLAPAAFADTFEDGMAAFEAREYQKALNLWQNLAEQGDVNSQVNIGEMYARGLGVTRNATKALEWFKKAAAQGSATAEFNLGEMYGYGHGIPVDHKRSIEWYRKAAQQGHTSARYKLGAKYFKGEGVAMDYLMAYAWMDMAAKQGSGLAANYRDLIASILKPDELKKATALADELSKQLTDPVSHQPDNN